MLMTLVEGAYSTDVTETGQREGGKTRDRGYVTELRQASKNNPQIPEVT